MKIMVIGAHPADCFDLAGGTLSLHYFKGNQFLLVSLTDGLRSHGAKGFNEKDKKNEFRQAANYIKAESVFFDCPDEPLIMGSRDIEKIVKWIRTFRPDILITHHPNEFTHWDHAECGKAVCRALKAAVKLPIGFYGEKHFVPMVYFFGVQFRPEMARIGYNPQPPTLLVDISSVLDIKIKMMSCFKSQGITEEVMRKRVKSFEGEMGRAEGIEYSEGFISYYPFKTTGLYGNSLVSFYTKEG